MTSKSQSGAAAFSQVAGTRSQRIKRDRQGRKYGFACANCRRRKARCNGNLPSCDRCLENNETCYFDKAPSITYAVALQDRLKASEAILEQLRNACEEERPKLLEDYFNRKNTKARPPRASESHSSPPKESPQSDVSTEDEVTELLNQATVAEDGRISFYGRTSLYHLQPEQMVKIHRTESASGQPDPLPYINPMDRTPSILSASPAASQHTDLASILSADVSHDLVNELLDVYWCWPHHLHLVLSRKIFMRDLASSGPYVTVFLLNCTLAQAARFSDRSDAPDLSAYFARKALAGLAEEIDRGSSIPTLQGLLILSARECAAGRTSQGWLYSGMAFRMMRDLGIHIHPKSLSHVVGQFSSEDLALRLQVFWSCYTWDKTMSLCLGRPPTIHERMPVPSPETWFDGEEMENESWYPHFSTSIPLDVGISQKSSTNSRFSAYCHLCIMIDDILDTLYSRPHAGQNHLSGYLESTMAKLDNWSKDLPSHLYIHESSRVASCPPLHILLLNLLYHATIILLCRPYRSKDPKARATATKAAEMIDRLSTLHVRRFGFRVLTYLETYTIFVGATVNILDLKEGKEEEAEAARARLAFNVEILRNARSTISTLKCVEIIERCLRNDETMMPTNIDDNVRRARFRNFRASSSDQSSIRSALPVFSSDQNSTSKQQFSHLASPTQLHESKNADNPREGVDFQSFSDIANTQLGIDNLFEANALLSDPQTSLIPDGSTAMQVNGNSIVDTPLRWLPDNLRDDCSWMMMGVDFASTLDARRN